MNTKKLWWFVAVSYAWEGDKQDTDIVKTTDYEKALNFAQTVWRNDVEEYQRTEVAGILGVQFFDGKGRVLWDSNAEPDGLGTTGYIDHVRALQSGKGTGPALGPVDAVKLRTLD